MDDEPMWAADCVVAMTQGSAITIPETANEFSIKGNTNSDTDKIMGRMDAMTIKMDAQYKELQSYVKQPTPDLNDDDIPMSHEEEAKFMQTFSVRINVPLVDVLATMPNYGKFLKELISNKLKIEQISAAFLSDESSAILQNKVPPKLGDPGSFLIPCNFNKTFNCNSLADLGTSINLMPYFLYAKLSLESLKPTKISVTLTDRSFQYPVGIAENMLVQVGKFTFSANFVILEMEEDNKKILTLFLRKEAKSFIPSKESFLKFAAMTADEIYDSKSDKEEPPFEKITINTYYKIKTSLEEPPMDLELKPLPDNLEYVLLEEPSFLPIIISAQLFAQNKSKLVSVLKRQKEAFSWKTTDIPSICLSFCKHKIQLLDNKKPVVQKQKRLNPNMQEVVKKNHETLGYRLNNTGGAWIGVWHFTLGDLYNWSIILHVVEYTCLAFRFAYQIKGNVQLNCGGEPNRKT
ncbi:reverse transcriptase domain-containing protein [Tanacetum coccineum]